MKHLPRPALAHLNGALAALAAEGLRRHRPLPYEGARPSFCSNDYLGLAAPAHRTGVAGPSQARPGAGASRLVAGESAAHRELETAVAGWLSVEAALTFTSGYAANLGVLSALVQPGDRVISDALNHASIIDGCRLARAEVIVVPHLDHAAIDRALKRPNPRPGSGRSWVVTESYFSMDGDVPDLRRLRGSCDETGAGLIVDEAHALGVLGPDGRGLCAAAGVVPDALVGTFGKAFGRQGAFVAGDAVLVDWLWNRARSFVFSTGLSPALAESTLDAFEHARTHPELRAQCLARSDSLRAGLGPRAPAGPRGPIIPIVVGDPTLAVEIARRACEQGVHIQAIRPPTVPRNSARLRLTASAAQSDEDVAFALNVLLPLLG